MLDNMAFFEWLAWGYESLLIPSTLPATEQQGHGAGNLLRIHVGLEDVTDLKEDEMGLDRWNTPRYS